MKSFPIYITLFIHSFIHFDGHSKRVSTEPKLRHTSRSSIQDSSSPTLHRPVSLKRVSTKVCTGRPLAFLPCFGDHVTRWWAGDFWSLNECPASWSLRLRMMLESLTISPYSSLLVILSFQVTLWTFRSIFVYVWSNLLSSVSVNGQVELP